MSDDLAPQYLASRVQDPELEADLARAKEARKYDAEQAFQKEASLTGLVGRDEMPADATGAGRWLMNLPKNITVGVMDAALNALSAVEEVGAEAGSKAAGVSKETARAANPTSPAMAWMMHAGRNLRGELGKNSDTADQITQSAAQFFLPFAGYLKGMGGMQKADKVTKVARGVVAEAATVSTAFEPHEARFADLLRLADPQNALVNRYIDYMAVDDDEGEMEGRFKNVLDNLALSAGIGTLIGSSAFAIKASKYAAMNAGAGPVGLAAQGGWMGFHGSPVSGIQRLKPGTGSSARGHGIYLAEDKSVAGGYRTDDGSLYTVHVPDEVTDQMMKWDESINAQPKVKKFFESHGISGNINAGTAYRRLSEKMKPPATGLVSWKQLDIDPAGDQATSRLLDEAGIPGIVYPASGRLSQGGSTGDNLVLFNEQHATIKAERSGKNPK